MNYRIIPTTEFEKELKKLSRKYPSIKADLQVLAQSLSHNPIQGIALGNNCYKLRMAVASKAKGKSSGARVITFVKVVNETVLLISIYDKSAQSTISDDEIKSRLKAFK